MADMGEGRPSVYSDELVETICLLISEGMTLRNVCAQEGMPTTTTVFRWLADPQKTAFREQYAQAKAAQAEVMAEEILEIADDGTNDWQEKEGKDGNTFIALNSEHIQRSRLRVDTRKWLMSKMLPKKYGDANHLKISNPEGGPVGIDLKTATDEELDARLAELEGKEAD